MLPARDGPTSQWMPSSIYGTPQVKQRKATTQRSRLTTGSDEWAILGSNQ
jgi:hypothetical protein